MAFDFQTPAEDVDMVAIPASGITTNVYAVGSPGDKLIIDTGTACAAAELIETLQASGLKPSSVQAVIVTHGHLDHYGGAAALAAWSGAPVWAHPAAAAEIEDHRGDFLRFSRTGFLTWEEFKEITGNEVRVERLLRDDDCVEAGGMRMKVHHLPGHERGLIALFEPQRRLAFVGDLVQGGTDCSDNWLGLFSDPAAQRESLKRLIAMEPAWLFKGHRCPRSGGEVAKDITAALGRLDAIEASLRAALAGGEALTLVEATRAAFRDVLGMEVKTAPPWGRVTVNAFLHHLAERGLARLTAEMTWKDTPAAS